MNAMISKDFKHNENVIDFGLAKLSKKKALGTTTFGLMAISLSACGSGSSTTSTTTSTTTTTTTTTPTATSGAVFELIGNAGTVTFYNPGTAITLTESGTTLSFASSGGVMGDGTATIADSLASTISIPTGTALTAAGSVLDGKATSGTGDLVITGVTASNDLTGVGHSGNITISGTAAAAGLVAMDVDTTNKIDATGVTTIVGTTADVKNAMNDQLTIDTAADAAATINDASATAITAADLALVGGYTTGTVTVSNAIAISGTVAQGVAALVTAGTKVTAATAAVTLTDADATAITITDLSDIGSATSGTVTVSNAITTSGTKVQITAAFDTTASKVVAATAAVTISTDTTISAADVETFETAIGALNLGSAVTVTIAAGADADFEATTVDNDTLSINGTGDNNGETLTITGTSSADTIRMGNVTIDTNDITVININAGDGADTIVGTNGADKVTGGGGADSIAVGSGVDTVVFSAVTDGGSAVTLTDVSDATDDFTVTLGTTTDSITSDWAVASDFIEIGGTLKAALTAAADAATGSSTVDANAAGVVIIDSGDSKLAAGAGTDADFGDITLVKAAFDSQTTNLTDGENIIFTLENNAGTKTGIYYLQNTTGDNAIDATDIITLLGVVADAALTTTEITFTA